MVSPQFHVRFDSKFQTMRRSFGEHQPPSEWQVKCGFVSRKDNAKRVQLETPTIPVRDLLPNQMEQQQTHGNAEQIPQQEDNLQ